MWLQQGFTTKLNQLRQDAAELECKGMFGRAAAKWKEAAELCSSQSEWNWCKAREAFCNTRFVRKN